MAARRHWFREPERIRKQWKERRCRNTVVGLAAKDVDFMVDQYDVLKAAVAQNPIDMTKDDVRRMMHAMA